MADASPGMYRSDRRLYVNRDRSKIVEESSPEAAFVLVGAGGELPLAEAKRLGLLESKEAKGPTEDKARSGPSSTKAPVRTPEPPAPPKAPPGGPEPPVEDDDEAEPAENK